MKASAITYHFGPFELDPVRYELLRQGHRLRVPASLMELLLLLVNRPGELVTREQIVAALWKEPGSVDVRQGINTAVARLRAVLGDDPANPRYLETVIGRGYRFIALVEEVEADGTDEVAELPVVDNTQPTSTDPLAGLLTYPVQVDGWSEPQKPTEGASQARGRSLRPAFAGALSGIALAVLLASVYFFQQPKPSTLWIPRQITTNDIDASVTAAALSSDGQSLVYATPSGLFLREMATGRLHQIKAPPLRTTRLAWFPNHHQVLVTGYADGSEAPEIWFASTTGEEPRLFRHSADSAVPSPDGERIGFIVEDGRSVHIANADGGDDRVLVKDNAAGTFSALFWSANGERISYQQRHFIGSGNEQLDSDYQWSYSSRDVNTGEQTALVKDMPFDSAAESANGTIFYLRARESLDPNDRGMWRLAANPHTGALLGKPVPICSAVNTDRLAGISVTADGKQVCAVKEFWQPDVFVGNLHRTGPTLDNVQRLTTNTKSDFPHAWDITSQFVYFESNREDSDLYHVFRQQPGQPDGETLTIGQDAQILATVMPDGKTLLYEQRNQALDEKLKSVFRANMDGSNPRLLWKEGVLDEWRCPVLSGTACVVREIDEQHFVFYALDLDHGKGRLLARSARLSNLMGDWALSPDGRTAAIPDHDKNSPSIQLVRLDGTEGETKIKVDRPMHLRGLAWAADGSGFFAGVDIGAASRLEFISTTGKATELRNTAMDTWAVPSPDGKRMAFVDSSTSRNVYTWQ